MGVSMLFGVVISGGMSVVIFIFGGACASVRGASEDADFSLQPVAVMRAKAMMQPSEGSTSRISFIGLEPQVSYSVVTIGFAKTSLLLVKLTLRPCKSDTAITTYSNAVMVSFHQFKLTGLTGLAEPGFERAVETHARPLPAWSHSACAGYSLTAKLDWACSKAFWSAAEIFSSPSRMTTFAIVPVNLKGTW